MSTRNLNRRSGHPSAYAADRAYTFAIDAAEDRGHLARTQGAAAGALVGAVAGSFNGVGAAGVGAGIGALIGALIGEVIGD